MSLTAFVNAAPLLASRSASVKVHYSLHRSQSTPHRAHSVPIPRATIVDADNDQTQTILPQSPEDPLLSTPVIIALATAAALFSDGVAPAEAIPAALKEAFKTMPANLLHPAVMWGAVAATLYTFYLGTQVREIRSAEPERRKELVQARVSDRHYRTSAILFSITTITTFAGMANTYNRAGKLFPGPHLYAGLGIVALMSLMSSMVPYMQKGKLWAKNAHFAMAFGVTALFGWQAKSGMMIVGKLLGWGK